MLVIDIRIKTIIEAEFSKLFVSPVGIKVATSVKVDKTNIFISPSSYCQP